MPRILRQVPVTIAVYLTVKLIRTVVGFVLLLLLDSLVVRYVIPLRVRCRGFLEAKRDASVEAIRESKQVLSR